MCVYSSNFSVPSADLKTLLSHYFFSSQTLQSLLDLRLLLQFSKELTSPLCVPVVLMATPHPPFHGWITMEVVSLMELAFLGQPLSV